MDSVITLQPERLVTDRQGRGLNDVGFDPSRGVTVTARYVVPVGAGGQSVAVYPHGCAVSMDDAQWRAIATRGAQRAPLPIYRLKLLATPLPRRDGLGVLAMQLPEFDALDQTIRRSLTENGEDAELNRRVDPLPYRVVAPDRGDLAVIDVEWARLSVLDALPVRRCQLLAVVLPTSGRTLNQLAMGPRTAALPPAMDVEPTRQGRPLTATGTGDDLSVAARRTLPAMTPPTPSTTLSPAGTSARPMEEAPALGAKARPSATGRATDRMAADATPRTPSKTGKNRTRSVARREPAPRPSTPAAKNEASVEAGDDGNREPTAPGQTPTTRTWSTPQASSPAISAPSAAGPSPGSSTASPRGGLVFGRARPGAPAPALMEPAQPPRSRLDATPNPPQRVNKVGNDSGSWVDLRLLRRPDSTQRR